MRILILFFFTGITFGQKLHHQTLSANGQVATTISGIRVSQSIGQQSTTGTSIKNNLIVSQGFQQNNINSKVFSSNHTIVYPNPITDFVNFKMTTAVKGKISFLLFDVQGKLIFQKEKEADGLILSITNLALPAGKYFIKLEGENYSFKTSILKSK